MFKLFSSSSSKNVITDNLLNLNTTVFTRIHRSDLYLATIEVYFSPIDKYTMFLKNTYQQMIHTGRFNKNYLKEMHTVPVSQFLLSTANKYGNENTRLDTFINSCVDILELHKNRNIDDVYSIGLDMLSINIESISITLNSIELLLSD